jgi:hypothetical protein
VTNEDLQTTEDIRDHMRGTLELIAGVRHEVFTEDDEITKGCEVWGDKTVTGFDTSAFYVPSTCPICMAVTCLQQIDEAETVGVL